MPSPVQLASWLGCFAFLLMIVNSGMKLVDRFRGHPPVEQLDQQMRHGSIEVQRRLDDLEKLNAEGVGRRRAMYDKMEGIERRLSAELRENTTAIQAQIGHVREEVAALKTDTLNQNRHLAHIEAKLDREIERKERKT